MEARIKTAIEFLKDNKSLKVGELRLGADKRGVIEVTGWSHYTIFSNLTKQGCLKELEEIKTLFYKMVDVSLDLKKFIEKKPVEFNLYFDDYGKGSIGLCKDKNGIIEWISNLDQ